VRTCLFLRYSSSDWVGRYLRLWSVIRNICDEHLIIIFLYSLSVFAFITDFVKTVVFNEILLPCFDFDCVIKSASGNSFLRIRLIPIKIRNLLTCWINLSYSTCICWLSSRSSSLTVFFVSFVKEHTSSFIWACSTTNLTNIFCLFSTYKWPRLGSRGLPRNYVAEWRSASFCKYYFIVFLLHFLLVKCCFLDVIKQS